MKNICVVGSINADLMLQVDKLPLPGETLTGTSFEILPGGKGMNQAVCAAKLGADVTMAGCVGDDEYKDMLLQVLKDNQIITDYVRICPENTGLAIVTTSPEDNNIIVIPGANYEVDMDYIHSVREVIVSSHMVLLQLEIPIETVYYVIDLCYENKIPVILNPAPAKDLKKEYIDKVTYFTPNENELAKIFGQPAEDVLALYPNKIIMSAGKDGAYFHNGEELVHCKAETIQVVDTTGAGDAFNGALAVFILLGKDLEEAVKSANKVAALTASAKGAQGAMPNINTLGGWVEK